MKRMALAIFCVLLCCPWALAPAGATARRATVVVADGWPLHRPLKTVVVHSPRTAVRVQTTGYLTPIAFGGSAIKQTTAQPLDLFVWEDSEMLVKGDDWTDVTLNANARGGKLWLEIPDGKAQIDWAQITYGDGEAQVVDFGDKIHGAGLYALLNVEQGKTVDHVRLIARAKSSEVMLVVRMEKV
jgi:hypothetical protein